MKKYFILQVVIFILLFTSASAQGFFTGIITDAQKNPIPDANITISGTNSGTVSGTNGWFTMESIIGMNNIVIKHQGYHTWEKNILVKNDSTIDLGTIVLRQAVIGLSEVSVIASRAEDDLSPIAVSDISTHEIKQELGDRPFPMVMNSTAGVYSIRQGGGSGDASLFIRGFNQENIALLLNGIPISSVENGLVYWNNWLGLTSATQSIQIQKGIGISKAAINSVGGTVNIISNPIELDKSSSLNFSMTDYGNLSTSIGYSSGKMDNQMAISFLGSHTKGPGYIDATYVNAWGFYLSVSKEINPRHLLVFTALGGPEHHGQRNLLISKSEFDLHGNKFNKDWGSYNGKTNNASENFYFKPYITFNHYWKYSNRTFIANSLYYTPGSGGGKWSETHDFNTPSIFKYRNPSGQIDWSEIYENNANHSDSAMLYTGEFVTGFSKNVQTHFLARHQWAGILSNIEHHLNDNFTLSTGIHYRYFKSGLSEKIVDLLGGEFYIDNYIYAIDGGAGRNPVKTVGDIIKVNNGAIINYGNIFGQIKFRTKKINTFISVSASENFYQRYDSYNYVDDKKSKIINTAGWDIKTGIALIINEFNSIFANGGYFSRVPYFKFVFGNFTNVPSTNLKNETIYTSELGYHLLKDNFEVIINGYLTRWNDKSFLSNEYLQLETLSQTRALVRGLDAIHVGIELESTVKLWDGVRLKVFGAVGNWKWRNDVNAIQFNDQNVAVDTIEVYANGLYVGGAPQTQLGLTIDCNILQIMDFKIQGIYYDRLYADFDPTTRNNPADKNQPYQIPAYGTIDLHLGMPFNIYKNNVRFGISCYNMLNTIHIVRGEDGSTHNLESFKGFWSFGRTFNFSLAMNF